SHHHRGNRRRSGRENCPHSSDPRRTTRRSLRSARYLSSLRLLDSQLNRSDLILLCVITQRSRYCDGFGDLRVDEISMAALATPDNKSGSLKLGDKFSDLWWHVQASELSAAGFLRVS